LNLKTAFDRIATGYNASTGFYRPKLFVNPSRANTHIKSRHPQIIGPAEQAPLTDYWIDFESESGFEKVLPLATILVQVFIDQRYSLTLQGPIRTKSPSLI
jgi:hypothetical protein